MNYATALNHSNGRGSEDGFLVALSASDTVTAQPLDGDRDFVRRCQAHSCKGAPPFEPGERACRRCGRSRPRACAWIYADGGSAYEHALLRDAFDASFNGLNFVGRLSARLRRVEAGVWSIDEASVEVPSCYDAKPIPPAVLVSAALRQAGLGLATTRSSISTPDA